MIMGNPINSKDSIYPNIIASREDISEYLFHFTKGKEAISTLKNILSQQSLKKGEKNLRGEKRCVSKFGRSENI